MTGAIKRCTPRIAELAIACALLADGPQVLPVAVPQNLDAMVATVSNHKIAFRVERNAAEATQLPWATAFAAKAADVGAITQPKYLNAAVAPIMHDDVAVNIHGDAVGLA